MTQLGELSPAPTGVEELAAELRGAGPEEVLRWAATTFAPDIKLASSFAGESVVLIDMIARVAPEIGVFTVDTGRLPEETYQLIDEVRHRYGIEIQVLFPEAKAVEELVSTKGPFSFRESVESRKECCRIRKVEPLVRALSELRGWVTGLRKDEGPTRDGVDVAEWDQLHGLFKVNPLAHWSLEQVWSYIEEHRVPYNRLHDLGYLSIGCAPCTRPVAAGADQRSGRWWWEESQAKECGLHG